MSANQEQLEIEEVPVKRTLELSEGALDVLDGLVGDTYGENQSTCVGMLIKYEEDYSNYEQLFIRPEYYGQVWQEIESGIS
jgi:hypothetical protein